jgi:hypothetical protein
VPAEPVAVRAEILANRADRRISSLSTRKDSDTRSIFSAMNCSTKRPGNVMR